jgi:hypothetical protein
MTFMSASTLAVRLTTTLLVAFLSRKPAGQESVGVVRSNDRGSRRLAPRKSDEVANSHRRK